MERVNELGNRTIEMTQSEQCRENRPKKMNLWDYNKGSKGSLESQQGQEKEDRAEKNTQRNNGRKHPKCGKRLNCRVKKLGKP